MINFSRAPYILLSLLIIISLFLLWDENRALKHHKLHEYQDIQYTLFSTAELVTQKLIDLDRSVQLFADSQNKLIQHLHQNPNDRETFRKLAKALKSIFPYSTSVTLLTANGHVDISNLSGTLSADTQKEIQLFLEHDQQTQMSFQVDGENSIYFNILCKTDIGEAKPALLVVGFSSVLVSNILKNKQLHNHFLSIIQNFDGRSIVVDANGPNTNYQSLSENKNKSQSDSEVFNIDIKQTKWHLIYQPRTDTLAHIEHPTEFKIIAAIATIGTISLLVFVQLRRSNKETLEHNESLVEKSNQLLQLEKNLNVEKNRISSLLARMTSAYLALDETWKITDLNPMAEDFFYTDKSDLIGCSLWEKLPETASYFYKSLHAAMNQRTHVKFDGFYPPHNKWFEVNVYPTPEGIALLIEDITSKKEYINNIQEKALRVKAIVDSTSEGIFTVNHNGIIETFNRAAQKMFGYKEEEVIGQSISLLMPATVADKHDEFIKRYFRKGHSSVIGKMNEFEGKRKDGSRFPIELSVGVTGNAENTIFTGITHDITKRKEAELQAQEALKQKYYADIASDAKSSFLSNMSHEIRTPLTAIIGFSESLLQSHQSMEERQKAVKSIINSGNHLLQLINGILDLSKIESGKFEIEQREISLFELLDETRSIIATQAEKKGLEFNINYLFPLPKNIRADYLRLKQILINLCGNAIKFTETGHIILNISMNEAEKILRIEVVDTGIGMEQQAQLKIFEAFTQAETSTTRKFGGTGLGLSLSKHLAKLMGGDIFVESQIGKGSKFRVDLPIESDTAKEKIFSQKEIPINSEHSSDITNIEKLSGSVLIAEDNSAIQDLLSMWLNKLGLSTSIVSNGETAFQSALNANFDLVFMDMQMPIMGGIEATKLLREKHYNRPIIALTANAMNKDKEACLQAGCSDFLTKPIDFDSLYKACRKYLRRSPYNEIQPLYSELLQKEPDFVEIVAKFVGHQLPSLLETIKSAIEVKDWKCIKDIVHQIKGSGGGFGYPIITERAAQMEFQLIGENYSEVTILFDELQILMLRAKSGLNITNDIEAGFNQLVNVQKAG